ncbi:MAG: hypothetical protein D3910_25290 [Candidatus Electrothrix sp. ATG2]|nr:hypothetical protein [Candidatus Electrothrix sp. ATG2]
MWHGEFVQKLSGETVSFHLKTMLKTRCRSVMGGASYSNDEGYSVELVLYNGEFDGTILKVEYKNKKSYVFQKGIIFAEMNAKGDKLQGFFVGLSPSENTIIHGSVFLSNDYDLRSQ